MDKTFDAATAEARIYARWEREGCFRAGSGARPGAEPFAIVIPPPNVTGSLHMGHALNNTLQDILARWKRMQGADVLWQPGTDHAGIATQMVVERQLAETGNVSRREMGRETFVARVWEWKEQSGGQILNQLKRLGASCDWSRDRFTMDDGLSAAVLKVFVELYHTKGPDCRPLIYRDKRLVNWDPYFETAISDLEVEQVEARGKLWRFRYKLADGVTYRHQVAHDEDGNPTEWEERAYLVVATTRPETYLGDTAVAVHPDDPRYAGLIGRDVVLPMVNRRIPIVADEHADPEKGTGAVKITPAHDFNDFQVGKRRDLRMINVLDSKAHVTLEGNADFLEGCQPAPEAMQLDGLDRYAARERIVALAEEQGWLDGIDEEVHVVPHGDRSKVAIEPWLTDQWFVDAATLAKPAIAAVRAGDTRFVPKNWENTYFHWMENIEPWCISRQLWWGHQIPVWYGPDPVEFQRPFCAETEAEVISAAEAHYGHPVEILAESDLGREAVEYQVLKDGNLASYNKPLGLTRDPDVLDTWFSSALWPFSTLGWPEQTPELERYYPTSVLVTGFDIIFFWVARMIMFGLHFMRDERERPLIPFHEVYVHALVRDAHGKKMSKSLGNVIDPLELIEDYGADALRFTLASMAAMGRDIKLAVSRVEGYRNFATKIWNAARFAELNECRPVAGFDPARVEQTLNRWIVGETARVAAATHAALGTYRFNDAANGLYAHVWGVFCDWYVEFSKPLLLGDDPTARDETRATMAWALDQCLKLLHPFMPFVTEELWGQIAARPAMLVHADWPQLAGTLADPAADAEIGWLVKAIENIRSVRAEMNVPAGTQVTLVVTGADAAVRARLERNGALIGRLARLSGIAFAEEPPKGAVTVALEDCALSLPLAGVIDVAAEQARLDKALGKLEREIGGLGAKLANEKFLANAPPEVVEEQRERLAGAEAERDRLEAARARLSELA
ncbi:MAG TPA: valine--tRNA ligase [Thermohalobaculum sp.]|nr:valine--tRNA ligase [Thermohalobaculum sp.]